MRPALEFTKQHLANKPSDYHKVVGVEIGVCYGENAFAMLEEFTNLAVLHLVDPYTGRYPHYYKTARDKLAKHEHRIVWHVTSSEIAANHFTNNSIDFAYIDDGHSFQEVLRDIQAWYPKIIQNGILCGHDFCQHEHGLVRAVNLFTKNNNLPLHHENADWWTIKLDET